MRKVVLTVEVLAEEGVSAQEVRDAAALHLYFAPFDLQGGRVAWQGRELRVTVAADYGAGRASTPTPAATAAEPALAGSEAPR